MKMPSGTCVWAFAGRPVTLPCAGAGIGAPAPLPMRKQISPTGDLKRAQHFWFLSQNSPCGRTLVRCLIPCWIMEIGTCGICTGNNSKIKKWTSARQKQKGFRPLCTPQLTFSAHHSQWQKNVHKRLRHAYTRFERLHAWTLILYALLRSRKKPELPVAP